MSRMRYHGGAHGERNLAFCACFNFDFAEHILNMVFSNGDSIILLYGALVNSNFAGFKCQHIWIIGNATNHSS